MNEGRCDERLKVRVEESTCLVLRFVFGTQILQVYFYYESTNRKIKSKYICETECQCYERLQTKTKEFTSLSYTELVLDLEHLKIETR
jgi:hypothetical protein